MALFELIIALLFVGALLALWAGRIGVPYPALLALVGAGLAFVPVVPEVRLDPELALALFVAPTLLDAAYDASPRDLGRNFVPVLSLALVLVLLTVASVAWAFRATVPGVGWAAAIALGAIVAPPDASAANAVLSKLKPPHRLLVILGGESLFNDASALLVYRVAVGAAMTGAFSGWSLVPMLLLTCGGGVVVGWVLARVQIWFALRIKDIPVSVLLQFVSTFAVWMLAERMGLSAIITVAAYAMTLARHVAARLGARHRIASYAVWEFAVLTLNVLAFVLIGLQLRAVVSRIEDGQWTTFARAAGAVCATVLVVRFAWVMLHTALERHFVLRRGTTTPDAPSYADGLLASWCGMRGIVTLAAALALPAGAASAASFPHRDIIVFCAYCVVLTTLVLQGLTLRPLMRRLPLQDEGTVEHEIATARTETARAALRVLESAAPGSAAARGLRSDYEGRLQSAVGPAATAQDPDAQQMALHRKTVAAQRKALRALRARRSIGEEAFHVLEEEIDLLELTAEVRGRSPPVRGE